VGAGHVLGDDEVLDVVGSVQEPSSLARDDGPPGIRHRPITFQALDALRVRRTTDRSFTESRGWLRR
jgi:hypothetical protein